ncbi:alkaline phosphatase D family protein [Haloferula rosea]|uniref:Alkaline phosphatase family protein n=1 Tax=Haloferula rosea TaxID=490093 RepID=A0A934VD35_9BACT|nr:alkaline phosphatase D family protein [Haloferula rosea]MBK1825874.1 alkaline phosphatase family protein [Haloferula rosea]
MLRFITFRIVLATTSAALTQQASSFESGPMVGHTTSTGCLLWAYDSEADSCELSYWPATSDSVAAEKTIARPVRAGSAVYRHEITGLNASTQYQYTMRPAGGEPSEGSFTTAPRPSSPQSFSYLLTSCMDAKGFPQQPAWDEAIRQKPAFHIMAGDNTYSDSTKYHIIRDHHFQQRRIANFASLIANVPTYATWDDHDYGPNDSHRLTPGKEESLRAFKDLWANPTYGTKEIPGVFYSFEWGDVQFFVMDDRYHRDDEHTPKPKGKTQFGEAQRNWLLSGLKKSKATFKVVVNGYDIMGSRYPDEIKVISRYINQNRIPGVVFHSGDIHRNEFKQQDHGMGYPVTQITSSGVARNPIRPWAMIDVDTTSADPTLTARFFAEEKLEETHRISLSELTPHP